MAFTRKFLEALGIEEKQVEEIIASHSEVVSALKEQRDSYKADAEKLKEVQKELDDLKNKEPDGNEEKLKELQGKYDKLDKEFKTYKSDIEAKETKATKESAKRALLKEAGIADKYLDIIMKASADDLDKLELDDEGKIKDADKAKEAYAKAYPDFVSQTSVQGAAQNNPPANNGGVTKPTRAAELFKQHSADLYGNKTSKEE